MSIRMMIKQSVLVLSLVLGATTCGSLLVVLLSVADSVDCAWRCGDSWILEDVSPFHLSDNGPRC